MSNNTTAAATTTTAASAPLDANIAGYTPLAQPAKADLPFTIQGTP
jgi:hypothetical protein